ncbi:MAG: hypothetical protein EP330_17985 [Deltaproteobacteria bacterium]|nr:MAG: hypothetical protein EP330_17985 [Deltaproteobacteria bacterium]
MPPKDESSDTWFEGAEPTTEDVVPAGERFDPDAIRYLGSTLLGKGSMGRVLSVRDTFLGRRVAYKELRKTMRGGEPVGDALRARFVREARITARLDHPGIVAVHDIGHGADGELYYTMRYVQGETLERALAHADSLPARLALMPRVIDACQAMAYAHARSVVHRDLKPANIVLGQFGETVVVDWGLAKELEDDAFDLTAQTASTSFDSATSTHHGSVLGTPAYMSPEQASGLTAEADERSDVWSLGAVLFEILTGRRLVPDKDPKAAVERVRTGALPDPAQLEPRAPAELVAICRRALARDPDARYADAAQLARDLEAFQSGELVRAYAYSPLERFTRSVRRNRLPLGIAAVALIAVVAVTATSFQRVLTERDKARLAEEEGRLQLAASHERSATDALARGDAFEAEAFAVGSLLLAESPKARGVLAAVGAHRLPRLVQSHPLRCRDLQASGDALWCAGPSGVVDLVSGDTLTDLPSHRLAVDGDRVAIRSESSLLYFIDGTLRFRLEAGVDPFSARPVLLDEGLVASANRADLFRLDEQGEELWRTRGRGSVLDLGAFRGELLALAQTKGISRYDLTNGEALGHDYALGPQGTVCLELLEDGVAIGGGDGRVVRVDETLTEVASVKLDSPVWGLAVSADQRWLAATTEGHVLHVLDAKTLVPVFAGSVPGVDTLQAAWSGEHLFVASDELVTEWDASSLRPRVLPLREGISDVEFAANGSLLVADGDGWATRVRGEDHVVDFELLTDHEVLAAVADDGADGFYGANVRAGLLHVAADSDRQVLLHTNPRFWVRDIDPSPSGVFITSQDHVLRRVRDGEIEEVWAHDEAHPLWQADVAADGSRLAWTSSVNRLLVADLPDLTPVLDWTLPESPRAMALSPDGKTLAMATPSAGIAFVDVDTKDTEATFELDGLAISGVAFSPDGQLVAVSSWDRHVRIFARGPWRLVTDVVDHDHRVSDVSFSADGQLASGSWDHTLRFWSTEDLHTPASDLAARLARDRGLRLAGARLAWDPVVTTPARR